MKCLKQRTCGGRTAAPLCHTALVVGRHFWAVPHRWAHNGFARSLVAQAGSQTPSVRASAVQQATSAPIEKVVTPQPKPSGPQSEKFDVAAYTQWLVSQGVTGVGQADSKVELVQLTPTERGLRCKQALAEGEVALRIPLPLLIIDETGVGKDSQFFEDCPNTVKLAARLLKERAQGSKSAWYPYLCSMPGRVPCLVHVEDPSLWSEFEYPHLKSTVDHYQSLLKKYYNKLPREVIGDATYEDFVWAMTIVNSRSFEADGIELMLWTDTADTAAAPAAAPATPATPAAAATNAAKPSADAKGTTAAKAAKSTDAPATAPANGSSKPGKNGKGAGAPAAAAAAAGASSNGTAAAAAAAASTATPAAPAAAGGTGWWAERYLGMMIRAAAGGNHGNAGSAAALSPLRLRFFAPLLDMLNHAPSKKECEDSKIKIGRMPTANIRWYIRPKPQPAVKPAVQAATGKAAGFGAGKGPSGKQGGKKDKQKGSGTDKTQGAAVAAVAAPPMSAVTEWELQAVACQPVKAGDDLLLCYKPECANDAFALHYGFLPGLPPGLSRYDDTWLFDLGLPQALNWHCETFAVREPPLLPDLHKLENDQVLQVYEVAFDSGAAPFIMDGQNTDQPIKLEPGGEIPSVLLDAFSAIPGAVAAVRGGPDAAAAADPADAAGPRGKKAKAGASGASQKSKKDLKLAAAGMQHARAAVARYCVEMLKGMKPLLHDLETLSAAAAAAHAAQAPATPEGAAQQGSSKSGKQGKKQHKTQGADKGGQNGASKAAAATATTATAAPSKNGTANSVALAPLNSASISEAVAWAQTMHAFQKQVETAVQGLSDQTAPGKMAAAAALLSLAGYNAAGSAGGAARAPAGAAADPHYSALAVQYRANKKRILWDFILKSEPADLALALANEVQQ